MSTFVQTPPVASSNPVGTPEYSDGGLVGRVNGLPVLLAPIGDVPIGATNLTSLLPEVPNVIVDDNL